jgi:putative GTP pyrophosphokinase
MPRKSTKAAERWYQSARPAYIVFTRALESLLRELVRLEAIDVLAVEGRAKELESFSGKVRRKKYANPTTDITDLCGVRVITYLEGDVARVASLIRQHFSVDESQSLDKSAALDVDKVGYRSVHFVCELSSGRLKLPEYASFKGMNFEIQVRTALQHAWAQIEHDRNYKLSSDLPEPLKRRLYLAAGLLEMADREFQAIANDVDVYSASVTKQAAAGRLNVEINAPSVMSYMQERFGDRFPPAPTPEVRAHMIQELHAFGLATLQDIADLLTDERVEQIMSVEMGNTDVGVIRSAMMLEDMERYFANVWQKHWHSIDEDTKTMLDEALGRNRVEGILSPLGLWGEEEDESGEWEDDEGSVDPEKAD